MSIATSGRMRASRCISNSPSSPYSSSPSIPAASIMRATPRLESRWTSATRWQSRVVFPNPSGAITMVALTSFVRSLMSLKMRARWTALLSVGTDTPSWAPPVSPSGAFCSVSTKSHVFTCAISALLFPIPLVYNGTKRRWHNVRYMSDRLALRQMRVRFSAIPGQPPVLHELWLYFYLCAYFLHFISL